MGVLPLFLLFQSFPLPFPLCQLWLLFSPSPPFSYLIIQASCQTKPIFSLKGKNGAQRDVPFTRCGAFYLRRDMFCH